MAPRPRCGVFVPLAIFLTLVPVGAEWIIAPRKLQENHDYTGLQSIARIRSDKENFTKITYYLTGPGVDQPPIGIFSVDHGTGFVKIHSILDREEIPFYHLKGVAKYPDGSYAEKDIDLRITVEDVNDCVPVIKTQQVGNVSEASQEGTFIMRVIATDADEQGTVHSQLHYSIVQESDSAGMFSINPMTGEITVRQNSLDRETQDTYRLIVKASDLNGQQGGFSGSGELQIRILDINDNIPTLEKEMYEGSVMENTINTEVMRIKAVDMDLIHTDNWLAVYNIISGNEAGYFTITTDPNTNEGIIMIRKSLDYEELRVLNLQVAVSNKAAYNFGSQKVITAASRTKTYPIKINVLNQKEGPRFQPTVKVVTISEDRTSISLNKAITTYAAIDSDTLKTATNVRYAKIRDEDNWLIIDEKTAEIKLNKLPDRESKFLVNGTYYAEIICISNETPTKTATGTIAIQVEDFNDHCPKLETTTHTLCHTDTVIYVTAKDEDEHPNSAPFDFNVIQERSQGKWTVEILNGTTAILRDQAKLWPGIYKVAVEVKDLQGKSCDDDQTVDVTVCTCHEITKTCNSRSVKSAGLGTAGILLLLLGLLLLLLLPLLLLFCLCGSAADIAKFKPLPVETKQQLISYHTEGPGEDKEVPLLQVPTEVDSGNKIVDNLGWQEGYGSGHPAFGGGTFGISSKEMEMQALYERWMEQERIKRASSGTGMMTGQEEHFNKYKYEAFDGMALSDHFLGEYYLSKSNHAAEQAQQKDGLLVYDYEGQESVAGSVGCCSLLENDNDLDFLNNLGPKFKTLAEICQGSTLVTKTVDAGVSVSPIRPVSPVRPSTSSHTHVHTNSETIRGRDYINTNTINASNVASGSSTIVQEERIIRGAQGSVTVPTVPVQDKIVIPNQPVFIQQPTMYYAATPMYVVEPQAQAVLVAGGTQQQSLGQVGQIGLSQGLVQVGGLQGSQGVILVDRQVGVGGVTGQVTQGLPQGTLSRSTKVVLVQNGSMGGEPGEHLAQGSVQTRHGFTDQGLEVGSHGFQAKTFSLDSRGSTTSNEDSSLLAQSKLQGSQKVIVQHKKVSVTERNTESSTRA